MPGPPFTRSTVLDALTQVEVQVAEFFESLSPDEFNLRVGSAWTPAEHLKHLNTSVSAVARGFSMPRWLLRLRFGRPRRASRTYDELRDDYRARLAAGAGASGSFVPEPENTADRRAILARWHRVNSRLSAALDTWTDADLDRIQLPHPLLGAITAREMLFFTVYHGPHHIEAAQRRLPRFSPTDAA